MERLKAVLVGCGGMSQAWLKAAADRDDVEIVGLVDIVEESAARRKEEFKLSAAVTGTNLSEVLDRTGADLVFDVAIPESHADVTLTALGRGCHVMGEKPLADSMENAVRMVAAARKADRLFAVMQNRRYDSRCLGFKEFLASGAVGALTTLNSDFYIGAHFGGFRDRMQHVLLIDMAIHSFDQARFISGADPAAVYCHEWNPAGSWYDHDASAVAIFEMTDGLIYTYRGSWCAEGLNTSWECEWRAIGQKGSAIWNGADQYRAQVVNRTGEFFSGMEEREFGPSDHLKTGGHAGAIHEFLNCIHSGRTPQTSGEDNIKSLAMVFGAVESAEKGQRVEIRIPEF